MRKVILFITSSLDGFIARENGDIDWLFTDQDYGYTEFLKTIDTILMGGKTYRQVLGFDEEWPYGNRKTYVFTRDVSLTSTEDITYIHHDITDHVERLKKSAGKNIWLVGGGEINSMLLKAGLIDEIQLFLHPVFLGNGIPLFSEAIDETWLRIHDIEEFDSGLVRITYLKT